MAASSSLTEVDIAFTRDSTPRVAIVQNDTPEWPVARTTLIRPSRDHEMTTGQTVNNHRKWFYLLYLGGKLVFIEVDRREILFDEGKATLILRAVTSDITLTVTSPGLWSTQQSVSLDLDRVQSPPITRSDEICSNQSAVSPGLETSWIWSPQSLSLIFHPPTLLQQSVGCFSRARDLLDLVTSESLAHLSPPNPAAAIPKETSNTFLLFISHLVLLGLFPGRITVFPMFT
ncbi:hypothetical protein RRG08_063245 [Elysia crispata]|uniref:Uncharacterized protein n=1 Tax=Elysia crispata TaxID=231223 RepID=A0AAE1CUX8_9GAST|nr:hypothetical protein RRG08_063245 [Elysia crispata]